MIETEEVDDDYFTPVAKTSLANIFKKPLSDEKPENETLKYSSPIPKEIHKQEDPQTNRKYENIFSCIFDAYLWLDNVYTPKGKLGCAVVKLITTNFHNILLYNSNRSTVSSATATKELEVRVKGKDFISYYDCNEKYWCLYGSEDDIKKIIDVLKTCNVNIKVLKESDNVLPEQNKPESADLKVISNYRREKSHGSDTDSSINRKTKANILNRMANMGQSVLPPRTFSNEQTSESSDTNESDSHIMAVRPKPIKNNVKKNTTTTLLEQQRKIDVHKKAVAPRVHHSMESNMCMVDKLMPLENSTTIFSSTSVNDTNFFITEQRIANSELRISMTRMTDKVDNILNKVNNLEIKDKNEGATNINIDILLKLLKEYEKKINIYEDLFKKVDKDKNASQRGPLATAFLENDDDIVINNELLLLRNKVNELEKCIKQRDDDISLLNNEIKILKESKNLQNSKQNEELLEKISELEQILLVKNNMLANLTVQNDELVSRNDDDQIEMKIKSIMNDTFQATAVNFDNNDSYSGETIKSIIATVIKKVTIEYLNKSK